MEKGLNKSENGESVKKISSNANSSELRDTLADNEETMHEKLARLPQGYWDTINNESESGEKISEKHVYEANLSDIEKRFDKDSTEYKILQTLKKQGLRIFINPKTDISYTDKYNIIR